MSQKRTTFSTEERNYLRSLVLLNKDVVESKKSDSVSVVQKKMCWDEITNQFNCTGKFSTRTTAQLRKAWDNIKCRRKMELSAENRERMRTGGGRHTPDIASDPELDAVGIDIELDAVDSDTIASSTSYTVVGNNLVPTEIDSTAEIEVLTQGISPEENVAMITDSWPSTSEAPIPTQTKRGSKKKPDDEQMTRIRRNELLLKHEAEIHESRMEESRIRVTILEQELRHAEELFVAKMKNEENRLMILHQQLKQEKELFDKNMEALVSQNRVVEQ